MNDIILSCNIVRKRGGSPRKERRKRKKKRSTKNIKRAKKRKVEKKISKYNVLPEKNS